MIKLVVSKCDAISGGAAMILPFHIIRTHITSNHWKLELQPLTSITWGEKSKDSICCSNIIKPSIKDLYSKYSSDYYLTVTSYLIKSIY